MKKPFPLKLRSLKLKDQPDGKCLECRRNNSEKINFFWCQVPLTILSNPVCLQKRVMVELMALKDLASGGEDEDGDNEKSASL